jgi:tungstate transport system substrate-binding protein
MNQRTTPTPAWGGVRLRRRELGLAVAGTAAAALPAGLTGEPAAAATGARHHGHTVRLATIPAVQTGGLLNQLLAGFQAQSSYQVVTSVGQVADLYQRARDGQADLVVSHLGVPELAELVDDGIGRWPRLVLGTAFAYVVPPADPAGVRTAAGAVDAFRRIAQAQAPFVVNDLDNPRFLTDTLWHAAGQPDREGWYLDLQVSGPAAVRAASQRGGYTLWGLHPFLALQEQQPTDMRAVPFDDPLLRRVVASVVVRPGRGRWVNAPGALALEEFLLTPRTQGEIHRFRHPRFPTVPIFAPAAHHNARE